MKPVIPAILVATVLVAAAFSLAPVQQASTVHTDVLSGTVELRDVVETVTFPTDGDGDNDNTDEIRITGTGPFCIKAIFVDATQLTGDSVTFLGNVDGAITIDGFDVPSTGGAALVSDDDKVSIMPDIWAVEGNDLCTSTGTITIDLDTVGDRDGDALDITFVYLIADQLANPSVQIVDTT